MRASPSRLRLKSLGLALLVLAVSGQSGPCPFFSNPPVSRSGTVTLTASPFDTEHYEDFEIPAAPERSFNVTLTFSSPDALAPEDAFAEISFRCGLTGSATYDVPLSSAGLTTLTATAARDASSICIDSSSGQRQPAYWTLRVGRVAAQQITVQWQISYTSYLGIGQ